MTSSDPDNLSPAARVFLLVLVLITGGAVLALEVLGTRVIGTYYGSSLYVWAALLSVTMVCLAIGYAIGGRLADRLPHAWVLFLLVILAGVLTAGVPLVAGVIEPLGDRLGLAWGAIASALVIFFLPLVLLAMAGPYVIRLRARRVEGVGATSGAVYAVSTVGSVAGVLAVSFWMIPSLGTRVSLLVMAGVLVGIGLAGLVVATRGRGAPAALLLALPLLVPRADPPLPGELCHTESAYGDLRVLEQSRPGRGLHRLLMINGIMQTGMPMDVDFVGPGAILQSDRYYLELLPYFHPDLGEGRRGVLIGLAGGLFPRVMEFYPIDWTAVEIDVKVAVLAAAYFGYRGEVRDAAGRPLKVDLARFPNRASRLLEEHLAGLEGEARERHRAEHAEAGPYRGRAVIQDGRRFLERLAEPVDFIVLDAYNSDTIPFHLVTREFFRLVRRRLTDDGILAINYIGRPGEDVVTDALFRTLAEVFGPERLQAYRTGEDPEAVQVIIVLALRKAMDLVPLWRGPGAGPGADRLSYDLHRRRVDTARPGGLCLTDDLNPIDLVRAATALQWRRETMRLLGRESVSPPPPSDHSSIP